MFWTLLVHFGIRIHYYYYYQCSAVVHLTLNIINFDLIVCMSVHFISNFLFFSLFQSQLPTHHHQHRHSLTSRKVHRTRSSGATHHIFDDPMIEVCTQCQLITFSIYYSKPFARQTKLCISSTWIIILYWLTTIVRS